MHGELLEFNESLQRTVQTRDAVIGRLRAELVSLRGPLPDDDDMGDTASLSGRLPKVSGSDPHLLLCGSWFLLFSIWIRIRGGRNQTQTSKQKKLS